VTMQLSVSADDFRPAPSLERKETKKSPNLP
jgi:hypothetical protein